MLQAEKLAVAGRLAASVAHEINNPLEAITNLLFLITLTKTSVKRRHRLMRATRYDELESARPDDHAIRLISSSTSSPACPGLTMRSLEVVEGVVTNVSQPKLTSARDQPSTFKPANEVAIACMPTEAQQIFANLMANSTDARCRKKGSCLIRLQPSRDWRDRLSRRDARHILGDSGTGMDRATCSRHVFEPFFTTKAETGTGLGMWVVAQLVQRHNDVHVSRQRKGASGTVFSIFLPMAHPATADGTESNELPQHIAATRIRRESKHSGVIQ